MTYIIAYIATTLLFFILDFIWLGFVAKDFFQKHIGFLLADEFKLHIAGIFYLSYTIGIVIFCIIPAINAQNWLVALGYGCLFGFLAYGTYDFTNLATIKNWPSIVTVVDLSWGTIVTGLSSVAGYMAVRYFQK